MQGNISSTRKSADMCEFLKLNAQIYINLKFIRWAIYLSKFDIYNERL